MRSCGGWELGRAGNLKVLLFFGPLAPQGGQSLVEAERANETRLFRPTTVRVVGCRSNPTPA